MDKKQKKNKMNSICWLSLGIFLILTTLSQEARGIHYYSYQELQSFAQQFEEAVQAVHDGSPPQPTPAACQSLAALFAADARITSAGTPFTLKNFCNLWVAVGVSTHTTQFVQRQVESQVIPLSPQILSWWVVDVGVRSATNCSFQIPNVAWAVLSANTTRADPPAIQSLQFVTDSQAPCF